MSTLTYKCPSCGAPLTYDGAEQELHCASCGNRFEAETVRQVAEIESGDAPGEQADWDMPEASFTREEAARTRAFSCSSCGSELITDETTVATNCAFCGSPSIIPSQFTDETRPGSVIPFKIRKDEATKLFHDYFKGKKLIPNLFLRGRNQIDEIRQLYVPYWLFSCRADARMSFNGTQVSSSRSGKYLVTRTRHFLIHRAGTLDFSALPVDANSKLSNDITESIEPYDPGGAIPFSPETLSGAMANRADVDAAQCRQRANERVRSTTEQAFRDTVRGYASVTPRSASVRIGEGAAEPVLFPVWIITTKKENRTYTFAINGQTGELTCDIPYSKAKYHKWLWGLTALIAGGGFLVTAALAALGVIK